MKTKSLFSRAVLLAFLLSTINSQLSTVLAQGSLVPPGAPAPTMKSLDQIEPRTAITNAASLVTISQPGSYYLTHNLTVSTGDGIDIITNGVTLDLNGFTIRSTAASAAGNGIFVNANLMNIAIVNGFISSGVINNSGTYSGSGFIAGIFSPNNVGLHPPVNALVSRVSVSGCLSYGIYLGTGDSRLVESCTVRTVGNYGIVASSIKSCSAIDCGNNAIAGDQVSDCHGQSSDGRGVSAITAQSCYGESNTGNGLYATTALNCYGTTSGNSSFGLRATIAQNCYGNNNGGGTGLYGEELAIGCFGYANSGTGLSAQIANSCHGTTTSGTPQAITFKYNMP